MLGGIEFGRVGRHENGRFPYGVGVSGVPEDERRVKRGGEELTAARGREETGG